MKILTFDPVFDLACLSLSVAQDPCRKRASGGTQNFHFLYKDLRVNMANLATKLKFEVPFLFGQKDFCV